MALYPEKLEAKGFTLLELLVVIVILALLIAFIMPALHTAKLIAKQVVCAAQMKQWTLAELAYTTDNDNIVSPYADTCDWTNGGNALNNDSYWYNRLSPYLTTENYGKWGTKDVRRCSMGKASWGETAVWIGVYYSLFLPEQAPFVYLNEWRGTIVTKMCDPFKLTTVITPDSYLMMLDVRRNLVFDPVQWIWDTDYDGDGKNDSRSGVIAAELGPYNFAQPKIHRGGCNIGLFDGHVEWIDYGQFWEIGSDVFPVHRYWYNNNRP